MLNVFAECLGNFDARRRALSIEHIAMRYATTRDRELLDLLDFDMLAVVTNRTFNSQGVMFESTQSRHRPDFFTFNDTAVRGF